MKLHGVKECLDVHKSDISGSAFDDVNTSRATVGNVNLSGCSFKNVNMSGATFEDANLSGWKLHDVNLAGLKIVHANLAGASISQGRIDGMDNRGHSRNRPARGLPRQQVRGKMNMDFCAAKL
jgi:uncharacterized protein YjbI with pentapeptide repeats